MTAKPIRELFKQFIETDEFPCVGAKAALARGTIDFFDGDRIDRPTSDLPLFRALTEFGKSLDDNGPFLQSFVAAFEGPRDLSEKEFETALWDRLQSLHNLDVASGVSWTDQSSANPDSPHFSMSLGGQPYFVVGLHPNASRTARRFDYPILVFNSHEQFEQLREDGRFKRMQHVIRNRDAALDGDINPMVSDYGAASEARQYSGRKVSSNWDCPLELQEPTAEN